MRHFLSSSLVIGSLAWYSAALPQPQGSAAPSSITSSSTASGTPSSTQYPALAPSATIVNGAGSVEEIARKQNTNNCFSYYPPGYGPGPTQQCKDVCGNKTAEAAAQGDIPSIMCNANNSPWQRADGDRIRAYYELLALVAEYGAMAIPGVGQAVDAGMIAGIQAAKLAKYSFDATSDAVSAFQTWADPCGPSQLPPDVQNVFDILGSADDKVIPKGGWKPPAGLKQGGGKGN